MGICWSCSKLQKLHADHVVAFQKNLAKSWLYWVPDHNNMEDET